MNSSLTHRRLAFALFTTAAVALAGFVTSGQAQAAASAGAIPDYIKAAVADPARPAADTTRDGYRLPAESVAFSGMKPGDKVVDLLPGRGYFTRIFAKVVGPKGHVYAIQGPARMGGPPPGGAPAGGPPGGGPPAGGPPGGGPPGGGPPGGAPAGGPPGGAPAGGPPGGGPPGGGPPGGAPAGGPPGGARGGMPPGGMPSVDDLPKEATYGGVITAMRQETDKLQVPEPVDVVWTSLNYHDLAIPGRNTDRAAMNKAIFNALKPGGVYVVIDHAAPAGSGNSLSGTLHRVEGAWVRAEVEAAGFKFEAESNMLRNPADTYTQRLDGDTIPTQSDKFVYRFRKPAR